MRAWQSIVADGRRRLLAILPPERPPYETAWLRALPGCEVRIIHPELEARECKTVPLLGALFGSTARLTEYVGIENDVRWADVVVTIEVYSWTTRQASVLCRALEVSHAIIVWELLAGHPVYRIPFFRAVALQTARAEAKIIAVTEAARRHLDELGFNFEKIRVVYPAVRAPIGALAQNGSGIDDVVSIVFVGQLARHKGIIELTKIVAQLELEGFRVQLLVAGEGPQSRLLPTCSWLVFKGRVPYEAVSATFSSADIFCSLARVTHRFGLLTGAEQFSYSVAEAMQHGLPCVVTDVGALSEVVGGDPVQVVPEGNNAAAYLAIRRLLADRELRLEVGKRNLERARSKFDLATQGLALRDALFA